MNRLHRNVLLALAVVAIVIVVAILVPTGPRYGSAPVSSLERAQELAREGKRQQIITVSDGMIPLPETPVDGREVSTRLFAIPIGQITLAEPQRVSSSPSSSGYRGFNGGWRDPMGDRSDEPAPVYGSFNNIIIYEKTDGSMKKVFDKRIAVSAFKLMNHTTRRVLVITATAEDSDRDGAVDGRDIQRLYIYTLDDLQLHEVSGIEGSAGLAAAGIRDVDYVVVEATLDSDRDGSTQARTYVGGAGPEPQRLYRVDLATFVATPVMDQKLLDELQTTLDGLQQK